MLCYTYIPLQTVLLALCETCRLQVTVVCGGEALHDQDFERVEAHLQVTGPPQRMLLGSASSSAKGGSKKNIWKLSATKHLASWKA